MTEHEAMMIVTLHVHYRASFSKLGGLARAIWGEHAEEMVDGEWTKGALLGRALINRAEKTLGLQQCALDQMEMYEGLCTKCLRTAWYLSFADDQPKECWECGEKGVFLPANTQAQEPE